jgi:phospholipase C
MPTSGRIDHVVVLMLENRSFDHLFGFRPGVNGLKGDESNRAKPPDPTSQAYVVDNQAPFAVLVGQGPGHSFNAANWQQYNNKSGPAPGFPAANNGFVHSYLLELQSDHVPHPTPDQVRVVMQSFAPGRLPALHALADAFCLCDNWYSEVPGPTQPNRLYLHAATSAGYAHNDWSKIFPVHTIYNNLQDAGLTWATYEVDSNEVREFSQVNGQTENFKKYDDSFDDDVQAGKLANYVFLVPRFFDTHDQRANSQHAPQDARYGDNLIADVYESLRGNADLWAKTALVVTYDEHGGFYDHVIPPAQGVPSPDDIPSPAPGDHAAFALPKFAFDRLGFRVPAVIASPWVAAGKVDSARYQHTSILATVKNLFGLPTFLTKRDASAKPFDHLFGELSAPRTDTPATLPRAALPHTALAVDDPNNPGNQPLDSTQQEILLGVYHMTLGSQPHALAPAALPRTQAEASAFIQSCFARHFKAKH